MKLPGDLPHRRFNPLSGEWVLVSAHRTDRPWLGQQESVPLEQVPEHDPACYLCPGGRRSKGDVNPDYQGTFVFNNDFPALLDESGNSQLEGNNLLKWRESKGTTRVICYSPRHDLTLPELSLDGIEQVIITWMNQERELSAKYKYVQIFENKGQIMGASNPHPHGQIWAGDFVPSKIEKEDESQKRYFEAHGRTLLSDYVSQECDELERIVYQNTSWVSLVPFWATWPFETIIIPKIKLSRMSDMNENLVTDLADLLKILLSKYDKLFNVSFPFSMGWHTAPNVNGNNDHWTLHAHIYPPLLRSASIKKFMVGYEMMAESQRDITPEFAAGRLAEISV